MKLSKYVMSLSYLGTNYAGWQIQDNAKSVQGNIMNGLEAILNRKINLIVGAGRTDAGVHASKYFAHFELNQKLEVSDLTYKLNRFLPNDIVIHFIRAIAYDFHARFSAISRKYEYLISTKKDPFLINKAYFFFKKLNIDIMNKGANFLIGKHNFSTFSKSNNDNQMCCVNTAHWLLRGHVLIFSIESDRFVYNMVRCIVGTLIDLGIGKISFNQFVKITNSYDRNQAGASAPAQGLYLVNIKYPKSYHLEII